MVLALIPLIVCIAGLVIYSVTDKAKAMALGLWMFACGLFVTLWHIGPLLKL